jgi:hypothetical protein
VVVIEGESLLAGFEEEAFAEFEEEGLQLVNDGGFQFILGVMRAVIQAEELQHERVFDEVGGFFYDLAFAGEATDFIFVAAEGKALVKAAGDLALKLTDGPLVGGGLDLVESALGG